MAKCFQTAHSPCCPLLDRHSIPQRFRSNSAKCQVQQARHRLAAQSRESFADERRSIGSVDSSAQRQRNSITSAAAAAPEVLHTVQEHEIPRGQTAGAALVMQDVTIQAGRRDILENVSWLLMPGQKVGLVGANGAGKSTLLKCLSGQRKIDGGTLTVGNKVKMGYLEQTAVSGSELSVWDEARSRMTSLNDATAAIEAASQTATRHAGDKRAAYKLQQAMEQFEQAGGYDVDKRIANVLNGLGFKPEVWGKSCNEFSGGWQMRIALARLLLGPAGQSASTGQQGGLLLLDEPTNHLDSAATKWLASFLRESSGGLILVSHDQELLQGICNVIVEVRGQTLHHFTGDYNNYLEMRERRNQQIASTALRQEKKIENLEKFVSRFGAKASKASQAQSRAKQLEKLKSNVVAGPAEFSSEGPGDARKVRLVLPKAPTCADEVVALEGASIGWGEPGEGAEPLMKNVSFRVQADQRLLILGANGAGKSTLLKVLAGSVPVWEGERRLGEGTKISVFSQDLAQDLPMNQQAMDYVLEKANEHDVHIGADRARKVLGGLGLTGEMAFAKIGDLSGGEKARVALAAFSLVPCNLLLLDEASNHLDAQTITALTLALQVFDGAIVAVTHNKAFAESLLATHTLKIKGGEVDIRPQFTELYDSDFDWETKPEKEENAEDADSKDADSKDAKASKQKPAKQEVQKVASSTQSSAAAKKPKTKLKLGYREKEEWRRLPNEIDALTLKKDKLEQRLLQLTGDCHQEAAEIAMVLADLTTDIDTKFDRWLELEDLADP